MGGWTQLYKGAQMLVDLFGILLAARLMSALWLIRSVALIVTTMQWDKIR